MHSISSSIEAEDWLDISDTLSLPSLSLDDVLNEVSQLDDETLDEHLSGSLDQISPTSAAIPSTYKLDSAVKIERLDSISHQLVSFRSKNGTAVAVACTSSHTAVATSKGSLLLFNGEGRLERFWSSGESDGSASCVVFSNGGGHVAVGYSKGFVKIINVKSGVVEEHIKEAVQIGRGVLEILYLGSSHALLTLDSGGSVFEIRARYKFRLNIEKARIRCVFSGCNGEVVHMRMLPYHMLALLTISKILIVSTRLGGSLICVFPLRLDANYPPLLDFVVENSRSNGESSNIRICVGRGSSLSMFMLNPQHIGTKKKPVSLIHRIHLDEPVVNFRFITKSLLVAFNEKGNSLVVRGNKQASAQDCLAYRIPLVFSTSDFKGLATGGNVSPAMHCLAERACYQALCQKGSLSALVVLSHDELFELTLLTEDDQLELFISRGEYVSACFYLFDIFRGRTEVDEKFLNRVPGLLEDQLRRLVEMTMSGCKEGKVSDLIAHYKNYIAILLTVCVGTKKYKFLYEEIWPRVERDVLSRYIFLESLDEFVLDATLESPPPALVSAYITHLASEGHFSQLQAAVVRFPIQCIDLHYVMSTCKQNGLYDGIIYVMNKALCDYLSPLEEMLSDLSSFASNEVLSDSEVERGNRLLLYLHCCLAGRAYPYGDLPPEQVAIVPLQVYRCITSLKGKDGVNSSVPFPYLRLLLLFDAQQFTHMIRTCADAPIFRNEGRLQQLIGNIGRLSVELRNESALVHFLLLICQLVDSNGIIVPFEIVEDVVTTLMRMKWQSSLAELAIVETLRVVPEIDRKAILRMASSPVRKEICTFIYCAERKFVDLIKCYLKAAENKGIFSVIRQILHVDLTQQEYQDVTNVVCQYIPSLAEVSARECAEMVIDYFPNYFANLRPLTAEEKSSNFALLEAAFSVKRERQDNFLQMDEDVDELLFGVVFEGLVKQHPENLDSSLQDLLLYWLPTGSRTDFCLNLAAESECTNTTILLMETRNRIDDAFEIIYEQLQESGEDRQKFVHWLDKGLSFCSRHASGAHSKGWLIKIMRVVTRAVVEKEATDMELRLQSLSSGILENGSEHALELVECLLDYPAFRNGFFRDYAVLINKILGTCSHEAFLIKELIKCIDLESFEQLSSLRQQFSRNVALVTDDKCLLCRSSLNKAAYIFSCGHIVHMECDDGCRRCPCVDDITKRIVRRHNNLYISTLKPRSQQLFQTTRDIFMKWDESLLLVPH